MRGEVVVKGPERLVRYYMKDADLLWDEYDLQRDVEDAGKEGKHFERLCYWALAEKLITPDKAAELLAEIEEVKRTRL